MRQGYWSYGLSHKLSLHNHIGPPELLYMNLLPLTLTTNPRMVTRCRATEHNIGVGLEALVVFPDQTGD